jgi:hypothetical protein
MRFHPAGAPHFAQGARRRGIEIPSFASRSGSGIFRLLLLPLLLFLCLLLPPQHLLLLLLRLLLQRLSPFSTNPRATFSCTRVAQTRREFEAPLDLMYKFSAG